MGFREEDEEEVRWITRATSALLAMFLRWA